MWGSRPEQSAIMSKLFFTVNLLQLILIGLLFPLFDALAQDGSTPLPDKVLSTENSGTRATSSDTITPIPSPADAEAFSPATITPVVPKPALPDSIPANPTLANPSTLPSPVQDIDTSEDTEDKNGNPMLLPTLAVLVIFSLGYIAAHSLRNKKAKESNENDSRCLNIKKLLDKKLKELTDLKGRLQNETEDKLREEIREAAHGTLAGELLVLVEKAEKECGRLKKLYEECMLEFNTPTFQGIIVENSLKDSSILRSLNIQRSWQDGSWTLHDVLVDEGDALKIGQYLTDGPWYIHFWKPGGDDVLVVYKDKSFRIKHSEKSTWVDAVAYGKSIGIPSEQLDFPIN